MPDKAESIRIDGTEPTATLRSKTKILADGADLPIRGVDADIRRRPTGLPETAPWNELGFGVSDRRASVPIPWQVEVDEKGDIEDRRLNANCDPYVVTRLLVDTCCSALAG